MQRYTINLSKIQYSYILPLLDDLHIDYAPNNQTQDFIAQVEQDAKDYEKGRLKTKTLPQYKEQMQDFMQDLQEKYAHWI